MLEYDMDDAANLLSSNIETAKTHEKTIEEDLDFLRFVFFLMFPNSYNTESYLLINCLQKGCHKFFILV